MAGTAAAPGTATLKDELLKCPTLYACTSDLVVVMARLSADAQRLTVSAATTEGQNLSADFDEAALVAIRDSFYGNAATPWEKFFFEMQNIFNRNYVSFNKGGIVELSPPNATAKVQFRLNPTSEKVQENILSSLVNYHYIHVHLRDVEKQVAESTRQEAEVRTQAADLEKEEQHLKEGITRNKEQDENNQRRLADLQHQLAAAEHEKRKAGDAVEEEEEDEDANICRVRIPLGKKHAKDFDTNILKLVKSKFTVDRDGADAETAVFNSIVRPYTSSELSKVTANLPDQQRQQVWDVLTKIDDWDYDVFSLQSAMSGDDHDTLATQTHGGSLFVTMYALMFRYGLLQKFRIDERIFTNWLSVVEAGYHPNPYHNSMHAADVLHITHFILSKGGLIKKCNLTDEDQLAALFAAAVHDYDHPGINNSFHVKSQSYLAYLYNDRTVLENKHVSSIFELMKLPRFDVLQSLTEDQRRDVRDTVIEMILATDMSLHGKYVSQFKRRLQDNHDFVKKADVRLALAMAVKMADISNCGRPERIYLRWSNKIADEFYMQGDRERNLGMPCSPFMDRMQPAMGKGQIAFMNYIVIPMFDSISELVPDMRFSVDLTESNKSYWTRNDDSAQ